MLFVALGLIVLAGGAAALIAGGDDGSSGRGSNGGSTSTTTAADAQVPSPLTGLPMAAGRTSRPLLIVKIDNDPAARPQAGLNEADVVAEQMVEGGATRFAALYHSTDAEVGPVRSARSTDVNFASSFNRPLFAYSGASSVFEVLLRKSVFVDVGIDAVPGAYSRRDDYKAPSNLFSSTTALYDGAKFPGTTPVALWRHGAVSGDGATPAEQASLTFPGPAATKVSWEWDAAGKAWVRTQAGTPHVDRAGARVSAANVIVHFTTYKDSAIRDRSGAAVPEGELVGKGDAWFFADGKIVKGTWEKPSLTKPTEYKDGAGQPIALSPGRTWIELVPPGNVTVR